MPTYQYQCTDCGSSLEVRQSFSDDALTVCPECEGRLRKVFNAVGVVFKGSGFYRTDSRPTSSNGSGSGSTSSESPSTGSKESSNDSKSSKSSKPDTKSGSTTNATTAA